ncbi:BRCA1-A complex subunit Abraxas 1 [Cynara cardunculus var. scolymus]|uniref:BRCA1-A complex subunit Abraxas 1 n=1 Tax=Cynara cardunculus var. scolymus TaxID=59895 RepID=UPI000D62B997|nr:BRCA1-A complex subunit Abraxas 1 [Cynara cardunculus var. scolymus]XP_024966221.1 BRCA1-A complex subunit Abraxas 1 [Cynara cardunculus var. scolymus]
MDAISLHKIQISGPTLASLIQRVSSAAGDVDGLLFGRVSHITPLTLSDDSSAATTSDQPTLIATVTSFFSFTSTSTFYSASGQLDTPALNNLLSTSSSDDRLIGWFSGRRKTHLRPSMRESSVTSALASSIQFSSQVQNSHESHTFPPCIFFLLTTPFQDQLIHTHEYKAFQFQSSTDSFDPKTLDVVNLGPAFRGHYGNFTPNSPFPDLPFQVKGLNCESMVEDEGEKEKEKFGTLCDEGFKIGRLKILMGSEAANYTAELEELYNNMIKKLNGLAKLVEQSSARVLEQENHNMKLRYKVAGFE